MNGGGKSDRFVDTEEPFEQRRVGDLHAEKGEGRDLTKENLFRPNRYRTLGRGRGRHGGP